LTNDKPIDMPAAALMKIYTNTKKYSTSPPHRLSCGSLVNSSYSIIVCEIEFVCKSCAGITNSHFLLCKNCEKVLHHYLTLAWHRRRAAQTLKQYPAGWPWQAFGETGCLAYSDNEVRSSSIGITPPRLIGLIEAILHF
jgi:hypothetical protein